MEGGDGKVITRLQDGDVRIFGYLLDLGKSLKRWS